MIALFILKSLKEGRNPKKVGNKNVAALKQIEDDCMAQFERHPKHTGEKFNNKRGIYFRMSERLLHECTCDISSMLILLLIYPKWLVNYFESPIIAPYLIIFGVLCYLNQSFPQKLC